MKRKNGFTLIELLAVIIILGILMIIAIPSVTKYINDSRKSSYVDTAKELIGGARNVVNEGKLEMYSTNTTYYIPSSCIKTENGGEAESPYGKFKQAYIGVIYNGQGYKYYWISVDESGQGIKDITPLDKLDVDLIESDLKSEDIKNTVETTGIGNRSEIKILDCSTNSWDRQYHLDNTSNNVSEEDGGGSSSGGSGGGSSSNAVVYPEGKTKDTVVTGDIVTIDTEEFYVVKHDGSDLVLLSHYNLKVGNIYNSEEINTGVYSSSDSGYGLQSSDSKGWILGASSWKGTVEFSSTNYWSSSTFSYPADVYNSSSNLYQYVEAYKTSLEGMGATIKEARLLTYSEAVALGCNAASYTCNSAPAFVKETSYWLGSAADRIIDLWLVDSNGSFAYSNYDYDYNFGVRPVIVI